MEKSDSGKYEKARDKGDKKKMKKEDCPPFTRPHH